MRPRSLLLLVPRMIPGAGEAPQTYSPKLTSTSFVKRVMADDATTGHWAYNHPPCRPVTSVLKRTGAAAERFQRTFSSTMCSTSRDNPRASNEKFCEIYELVTNRIS